MNTLFGRRGRHILLVCWSLVVAFLLVLFGYQLRRGLQLETSVMELLPRSEKDPIFKTIRTSFQGSMGRMVLLVVEGGDGSRASGEGQQESGDRIRKILTSSEAFEQVRSVDQSWGRHYFDLYFPYRYQILAPSVRRQLQTEEPLPVLRRRIRRELHGSSMPMVSDILEDDPLLFFPELLQYWQEMQTDERGGEASIENAQTVVLAEIRGDPFRNRVQNRVHRAIQSCQNWLGDNRPEQSLQWTGVVRFAARSRKSMRGDVSFISSISLIGVVLLVLLAFRSLKHLLLLVVTILSGLLVAFTVSFELFSLHVITIAFGATLIGISVDYAFHYFTDYHLREASWTSWTGLKNIFPGIFLGFLTSILAFSSLGLTPFPALKQMAVFTCLGLTGSFLTVVCWFPFLFRDAEQPGNTRRSGGFFLLIVDLLIAFWDRLITDRSLRIWRWSGGLLLVLFVSAGFYVLSFQDRLENLGEVPESLQKTDQSIRQKAGIRDTGRYVLVESDQAQSLLERARRVTNRLEELQASGAIGGYWSVVPFLPSIDRQRADRRLVRNTISEQPDRSRRMLSGLGFRTEVINQLFQKLNRTGRDVSYLTPSKWKDHPASFGMRKLWLGSNEKSPSTLIILKGVEKESAVRKIVNGMDGAHYRNRSKRFTGLIRRYRRRAMTLTAVAYLLIGFILMLRYGLFPGLLVMVPAVGGSAVTVAILSLSGISMNLMHVVAFLLILGMGIDYAVFLAEAFRRGKNIRASMLALVLSALTTVLSFGCLAFADARVINAIGQTVFPGILIVLLLSPAVYCGMKNRDARA